MSKSEELVRALDEQRKMFDRSTDALEEADGGFAPAEGMFTVAQHVAHVAQTLEWFLDGAFRREDGPDTDFEAHVREVRKVTSLAEARRWIRRAWERGAEEIANRTDAELDLPFGGDVLGGAPKRLLVAMNADHAAHHRGALTVYARLLGKVAPIPYA
jgi:uncharacterized damage-inducible protein DinB